MRIIRKADLKEIWLEWAQSESDRFTYPSTLKDFDLLMQHQKNRCFIYGDVLFAQPVNYYIAEINKQDLKKCKFLRQVDDNGKEEETSNIKEYINKSLFKESPNYNNWNFIAIKRPNKNNLVFIDGLHRIKDWILSDKQSSPLPYFKKSDSLKGYIIETRKKLREFE